jgi:surface polysaccharide O-acyltransferase-like enzyme
MKRHQETDALKAFSIIGVIWIHSSALVQDSYIKIPSSYFRFCVPVFIIISFYLLGKKKLAKESQTFKDSIKEGKNRIIRLFIPFIFWSVFYILIFHFNDFNWRNITTYFGGENHNSTYNDFFSHFQLHSY